MKPTKWGIIDSKIKLTFTKMDGTEFKVNLPIIGLVTPTNNLVLNEKNISNLESFLPITYRNKEKFYAFLPPNPAIKVNVGD